MNILMIVAKQDFRDEEFQIPFDLFKERELEVDIASTEAGRCTGKLGTEISANKSFEDVHVDDYSAVVLVGGPGSKDLVGDEQLEQIIQDAVIKKRIVAAICYAPVILAKSGVLSGKAATVWDGDNNQSPILEEYGVHYVKKDVVVDENFITADGPSSAAEFAIAIVRALKH